MIIDNGFLRCYNTNRRYFIPFCELPFHPVSMVGQPENIRAVPCARRNLSGHFPCSTKRKEATMTAKKLISLLVAVMLVVGIFAIPASAAITCWCGLNAPYQKTTYDIRGNYTGQCPQCQSTTYSARVHEVFKCRAGHLTQIYAGKNCYYCYTHGPVSYF